MSTSRARAYSVTGGQRTHSKHEATRRAVQRTVAAIEQEFLDRAARPAMGIEKLEDRVLLSSTDMVVVGSAAADTFVIKRVGANVQVTGGVGGTQSFVIAAIKTLTVDGKAGNDTFTVDLTGGNPYPSGGIF